MIIATCQNQTKQTQTKNRNANKPTNPKGVGNTPHLHCNKQKHIARQWTDDFDWYKTATA